MMISCARGRHIARSPLVPSSSGPQVPRIQFRSSDRTTWRAAPAESGRARRGRAGREGARGRASGSGPSGAKHTRAGGELSSLTAVLLSSGAASIQSGGESGTSGIIPATIPPHLAWITGAAMPGISACRPTTRPKAQAERPRFLLR